MRHISALPVLLTASLLTGCFGFTTGGNGMYYGGGGVSLFLLIIVLALVFGRGRH